jgi:hypothetical protein
MRNCRMASHSRLVVRPGKYYVQAPVVFLSSDIELDHRHLPHDRLHFMSVDQVVSDDFEPRVSDSFGPNRALGTSR